MPSRHRRGTERHDRRSAQSLEPLRGGNWRLSPASLRDRVVWRCWSSSPDHRIVRLDDAARRLPTLAVHSLPEFPELRCVETSHTSRKIWQWLDCQRRIENIACFTLVTIGAVLRGKSPRLVM